MLKFRPTGKLQYKDWRTKYSVIVEVVVMKTMCNNSESVCRGIKRFTETGFLPLFEACNQDVILTDKFQIDFCD